jgi:hypothetical protein
MNGDNEKNARPEMTIGALEGIEVANLGEPRMFDSSHDSGRLTKGAPWSNS